MSWLITLGVLGILAALPIGVRLRYDEEGFFARVIVGPLSFALYPFPKKEKKQKKKKAGKGETVGAEIPPAREPPASSGAPQTDGTQKALPPQPEGTQAAQPGETQKALPKPPQPPPEPKTRKGGRILDFLPFVKLVLELGGDFLFRLLTFDRIFVRVILASGDKGALAMNYGKTWAALGNLLPLLDSRFRIKKRDIQVGCDFEASQSRILARADIRVTLGGVLVLVVHYGVRGLIEFIKFKRKQKRRCKQ